MWEAGWKPLLRPKLTEPGSERDGLPFTYVQGELRVSDTGMRLPNDPEPLSRLLVETDWRRFQE
jgi:hypothetical protein